MGEVSDAIAKKLRQGLRPTRLKVIDDSHRHVGHAGARSGGESHFTVIVASAQFEGLGAVQRQRIVYGLLAEELRGPVHALSVKALCPSES
ncbi:MAG TPA: BolA family protein [Caulobacteraceae bacterium]